MSNLNVFKMCTVLLRRENKNEINSLHEYSIFGVIYNLYIFSFQCALSNISLKMDDLLDQDLTAQILTSHVVHPEM